WRVPAASAPQAPAVGSHPFLAFMKVPKPWRHDTTTNRAACANTIWGRKETLFRWMCVEGDSRRGKTSRSNNTEIFRYVRSLYCYVICHLDGRLLPIGSKRNNNIPHSCHVHFQGPKAVSCYVQVLSLFFVAVALPRMVISLHRRT